MPVARKRGQRPDKAKQVNGLYVHSSPPRVLQLNSAHIRQLIRSGDVERLEQIVYDGQGKKLLSESSQDYKVKTFLRNVPMLMSKISLVHDAVNSGRLEELQSLLDEENEKSRKKLVLCKDEAGVGLLHKAVYYDLKNIAEYLIRAYPHIVSTKDTDGRTAFHYTPMCQNANAIQKLLKAAGADPAALDNRQHSAKYYKDHISELELPSPHRAANGIRRNTVTKESLNIKKSNLRIWIHQRDLASLQQVIWEGHGNKLLVEHSNNPRVKRFLEAVPHVLGVIKEVHSDVINDELDALKEHTSPPVPNILLISKDSNGLTPLHKAAGLGRQEIAEYIIAQNPKSLAATDNEGRTPLHYSALAKDGGKMFDYLIEAGADEATLDGKSKSAAFYKTRSNEIDAKLLQLIPDCPRKAKENPNFDWSILGVAAAAATTPTEEMEEKSLVEETETEPITATEEEATTEETNNNEELEVVDDIRNDVEVVDEITDDVDAVEEAVLVDEPPVDEVEAILDEAPPTPPPPFEEAEEENGHEVEQEDVQENVQEDLQENVQEEEHELPPVTERTPTPSSTIPEGDQAESPEPIAESHSTPELPLEDEIEGDEVEKSDAIVEPEDVIEGVVNGENEIESVNEQGATADDKDEAEIAEMVQSGNMEVLAGLVLSGDGDRLMGHTSEVPELQSFLDNVPIYMAKINRIHLAARDGNLKELQAALDRRKFAIARDKISPGGATPLHVATIFGNTSIVRYLAGRFPETVGAADDNGRTPLHYAAVIPDNGHYYNLLVHLGANTRAEDKFGHTPDFYRMNQGEFSHKLLLMDYGAEELADDMLSDKDPASAQVEMPFFCTEEGRYLASSLGDPLIKGLTEVANKRPEDPIAYLAQYLYNFANNNNNSVNGMATRGRSRGRTQEGLPMITSGSPLPVDNNNAVPVEVVTLEPNEHQPQEESAFNATSRDEHGQSMLHFAAARSHGRNALFQLLVETEINIGFRDELYRTARDISIQANIPENTVEIDRYVMQIATKGDTDKLVELLLDGYDHIIDIIDEDGVPIIEAVGNADQPDTVAFLHSILAFEERRERVHHAIREGNLNEVKEMLADENDTGSGKLLAIGRNSYGRCTLHIAVLCQQEEIVDFIASTFPDTLRIGDNLERIALHYAMGIEKIESISRVLIKAGAKRVLKDLKGRQPTYYFMNKSDILRLQEEEETF